MSITLDGLLQLAGTDAERFQKLGELARRLNALDQERAAIIAELAEFGVSEAVPPAPPARRPHADPPCAICGEPAEMEVDGAWLCEPHGEAAVDRALPAGPAAA
jgi:hypothetical protein